VVFFDYLVIILEKWEGIVASVPVSAADH